MADTNNIQGAVIGHNLGDNMGKGFEFSKWSKAGTPIPMDEIPTDRILLTNAEKRYGTVYGGTDDSRCTRLLMEALTSQGKWRGSDWAERYVYGFVRIPDGMYGRQMRAAKIALKAGMPVPGGSNESNGSLMAVSPIGLLALPLVTRLEMARDFAYLTHPTPAIAETNADYVEVLDRVLRGEAKSIQRTELPADPAGPAKGWCRLSYAIAVNALVDVVEGADVLDTYRRVIGLGGDTDTNAAIAGALIGAYVGLDGLPVHLMDTLVWRDELLTLTELLVLTA